MGNLRRHSRAEVEWARLSAGGTATRIGSGCWKGSGRLHDPLSQCFTSCAVLAGLSDSRDSGESRQAPWPSVFSARSQPLILHSSREGEGFVSSLRSTNRSRTGRVNGRDARVSFERDAPGRREIQDVDRLYSRPRHASLNSGVADGDVFPDEIVGACCSRDVNTVCVTGNRVFLDHIAAGAALNPDPKVISRLGVPVPMRFV
jgi:hypothetical protein